MKRWIFLLALLLLPVSAWAGNFECSTCAAVVDYTATNGFVWLSDGTDLSPYTSGVTGGYRITLVDSAGKKAVGKVGNAGSGVSTQVDRLAGAGDCAADFANKKGPSVTYDAVNDEYDVDGTQPGYTYIYKAGLCEVDYKPYLIIYTIKNHVVGTHTANINAITYGTYRSGNGTFSDYLTDGGTGNDGAYISFDDTFDGTLDDWFVYRILTPGATGLYVVWSSIDAGFNYNDTSGYTVTIKKRGGAGPRSRVGRRMR